MGWNDYKDLIVWQKAMNLVDEIYTVTKFLPPDEKYSLSDQMRRAAVSIPSNIAEGHGRKSETEFKQFLSIARGSVCELETQLLICQRRCFLTQDQLNVSLSLCEEVRKMLTKMMF